MLFTLIAMVPLQPDCNCRDFVLEGRRKIRIKRGALSLYSEQLIGAIEAALQQLVAEQI